MTAALLDALDGDLRAVSGSGVTGARFARYRYFNPYVREYVPPATLRSSCHPPVISSLVLRASAGHAQATFPDGDPDSGRLLG